MDYLGRPQGRYPDIFMLISLMNLVPDIALNDIDKSEAEAEEVLDEARPPKCVINELPEKRYISCRDFNKFESR
jgi:hypothetical protein